MTTTDPNAERAAIFTEWLGDQLGGGAPQAVTEPSVEPKTPRAPLPNPAQGASGRHPHVRDPAVAAREEFIDALRRTAGNPNRNEGGWRGLSLQQY